MKRQKFLRPFLPIDFAVVTGVCFTSCNRSTDELQPDTETVAPATEDPSVTFRSCFCSETCPIDLVIVSGTNVNVTICGDLNSTTGCGSFTSSCGSSNYPFATTFTASGCFCVANGRSFRVTNNSLSSVTIDIVVTGSMGTYSLPTPITIASGASQAFESPSNPDCDDAVNVFP